MTNGGFSQFFSNSSGNWVPETVEALQQIGAQLSLKLVAEAVALFPGGAAPRDREERCNVLFSFEERAPDFLAQLDKIYYRDVDALGGGQLEDLNQLLVDFLKRHADEPVVR